MKILYVATDRRAAELAAYALRNIAHDVKVSWAGSQSAAMAWAEGNRDIAALIFEADVDDPACAAFVGRLRDQGLAAPVFAVTAERDGAPPAMLGTGPDDYVVSSQSLLADLPDVVRRGLQRAQNRDTVAQKLRDAERALELLRQERAADAAAAAEKFRQREAELGTALDESVAIRSALEFRVTVVEAARQQAERQASIEQTAAVDLQAGLEARLLREASTREILERKLAEGQAARRALEERHSTELRSAAKDLAERQSHFDAGLAAADAARDALEQKLAKSHAALVRSEEQRESEAALAASDLARRKAEYSAAIAEVTRARDALAQKLSNTTATLEEIRQLRSAEAVAAAGHLARREQELAAMLVEASDARSALERQLADTEAASQLADERGSADRAAAARRQEEFEGLLAQAAATRSTLEQKLANLETAHQNAIERFTSELKTAASRLAERQAEHDAAALQAAAAREALEQQVRDGAMALERAAQDRAQDAADAATTRADLERRLGDVEAARERADERAMVELAAASRRESDLEAQLAQVADARAGLEQQLRDIQAAYERAQNERTEESAAAARHLARRETELGGLLTEAADTRTTLEQRLADSETARQAADERATLELAAAAQRHGDLEVRLELAASTRLALEQQLRDREAALEQARLEHAEESASAARHLAQRETELRTTIAEAAEIRTALERRLAEAEDAHRISEDRGSAERAAASQRQTELESQLDQAAAMRSALEQNLAAAEAAHRDADERHKSELSIAEAQLAESQAEYAARLLQAIAARDAVEQQLRTTAATLERVEQERAAQAEAASAHLARRESELGTMLTEAAETRTTLERRLADTEAARQLIEELAADERTAASLRQSELEAQIALEIEAKKVAEQDLTNTRQALGRLGLERDSLQLTLKTAHDQVQQLDTALAEERDGRGHERTAAEIDRLKQAAEYAALQRTLDEVREDHQAITRAASEHFAEVGRLSTLLTDRDARLQQLTDRHLASEQAAREALAEIESKLHAAVEAGNAEAATLQSDIKNLKRELEITTKDRDALRAKADRLPHLQTQLDESRAEIRRLLEHSPYGICRVTRDGSIVRVNRALLRLLGYRTADELRSTDFATGVFPSADDLRWLIERCLSTDAKETVETTWKRKDGRGRIIRLLAFAAPAESVEMIVEDITDLRTTEEKLGQAQRMEAVGRLASEVAVTCNHLLRDVSEDGHQWLDAIGSDSALRQRGELLLGEVTRAASFLQQIAVYGEQQTSALEPVNVTEVLRRLEPVLKRVAGDEITFVLPKTARPLNIDVGAERLERILVNIAGYARQRMPHGGRLKIDLTRVTVDGKFMARYPNVRPGAHALITVTEEHSQEASHWPNGHRNEPAGADGGQPSTAKPGVDVGVLLELVGDCGGHLWMAAEPSGNMVLKIHLPQRVSDGLAEPQAPSPRTVEERSTGRWFGH